MCLSTTIFIILQRSSKVNSFFKKFSRNFFVRRTEFIICPSDVSFIQSIAKNFVTVLGDKHHYFPLCRRLTIGCIDCPAVFLVDKYLVRTHIDHWLDCEYHTRNQKHFLACL